MKNSTVNTNNIVTEVTVSLDAKKMLIDTLLRNVATIGGIKLAEIPLTLLEIHPTVQRPRKGHERKIAAEWSRDKAGAIRVSYRDGHLYIIDGQHRFLAAQLAGETSIACHISEGMDEANEAIAFATQGENTTRVNTKDKVKALLLAPKDPRAAAAVALSKICKEFNVSLLPKDSNDKPSLGGVRAATCTISNHGEDALRWCFDVIKNANWRMVEGAYSETMILCLRAIYINHKNELDFTMKVLVKALRPLTLNLLAAKAGITYIGRGKQGAIIAMLESAIENSRKSLEK